MDDSRHTAPVAFVLTREDSGDVVMLGGISVSGHAASCFLSMFDALIFGLHQSRQTGETYAVRRASEFLHAFMDDNYHQKSVGLHMAWPAREGRLLVRADGRLHDVQWVQEARLPGAPTLCLDEEALVFVDGIYEQAGLFAWRETADHVLTWSASRLRYSVDRALTIMPTKCLLDAREFTQFALYDPEFEQWHFVPRALFGMPIQGT